jgi:hypothetical protein
MYSHIILLALFVGTMASAFDVLPDVQKRLLRSKPDHVIKNSFKLKQVQVVDHSAKLDMDTADVWERNGGDDDDDIQGGKEQYIGNGPIQREHAKNAEIVVYRKVL